MYRKGLAVTLVMGALSGCSSLNIGADDYGCKGLPYGVTCMSARDVYAATHQGAVLRSMQPEAEAGSTSDTASAATTIPSTADKPRQTARVDAEPQSPHYLPLPLDDEPQPVRTASRVMRIWIAPWEDKSGDLHASGHVYTEVEPRKWTIGHRQEISTPILTPLQLAPHIPAQAAPPPQVN